MLPSTMLALIVKTATPPLHFALVGRGRWQGPGGAGARIAILEDELRQVRTAQVAECQLHLAVDRAASRACERQLDLLPRLYRTRQGGGVESNQRGVCELAERTVERIHALIVLMSVAAGERQQAKGEREN